MRKLEEIKLLFEHKNYAVRSDFIDEYNFKDKYLEYYRQFILNAKNVKDHMYLSDLIDLSGWLNIYDKELRDRWFSYLFANQHYLVKLAVLDYFKYSKAEFIGSSYEKKLSQLLGKKMFLILRSQILFNLICLNTKKCDLYIEALKKVLTNTVDWKIVHRTLTNIKGVKIRKKSRLKICSHIKSLAQKRTFVERTENLLREVCEAVNCK